MEDLSNVEAGRRVVDALGEVGAWDLLDVLTRPQAERVVVIHQLHLRADTTTLAETLLDLERIPTTSPGCG